MSELAPIALFVYNRPWHVRQTVDALKKNKLAGASDLFIYSDGPKNPGDRENIQAVRDYLQTISGFKTVKIVRQKTNIGLADSIISGVTEVINKYGKIIVLEDDLLTAVDFLRFMNEALEYYSKKNRVMQISGHMFNLVIKVKTDGVFLPFTNSIGWGTWQRAWDSLDSKMSGYEIVKENKDLRKKFNLEGAYNFFDMLEAQLKGKIDSWAIRWYLSVFLVEGLVLYPKHSLIKHIGFDSSATHCKGSGTGGYSVSLGALPNIPLKFPAVFLDKRSYMQIIQYLNSRRSIMTKVKSLCSRLFRMLFFTTKCDSQ